MNSRECDIVEVLMLPLVLSFSLFKPNNTKVTCRLLENQLLTLHPVTAMSIAWLQKSYHLLKPVEAGCGMSNHKQLQGFKAGES